MKITPLEIKQKSFEKKIRGYDKDEVNAFLGSLSSEWERIIDENKELKIKLTQSEKEVGKLREVESSLFKTLKTAEDTGANLVEQANKAAELHLKEAEMNAEAVLSESKSKSKSIIENAEQKAKELIDEMQFAIKELEENYKQIENHRDNLVTELKNIASDLIDRINRTTKQHKKFSIQNHLIKVRDMVRESESGIDKEKLSIEIPKSSNIPSISGDDNARGKLQEFISSKNENARAKQEQENKLKEGKEKSKSGEGSFFDQIDN